jgi:hypothetical protein
MREEREQFTELNAGNVAVNLPQSRLIGTSTVLNAITILKTIGLRYEIMSIVIKV